MPRALSADRVGPEVQLGQRPVDLEHARQRLRPCSANLVDVELQCLQGVVGLECLAKSCCALVTDLVAVQVRSFQCPVEKSNDVPKVSFYCATMCCDI